MSIQHQARIFYADGSIATFKSPTQAYQTWLNLPTGTRAAFRAANDSRPVYGWDYVDKS